MEKVREGGYFRSNRDSIRLENFGKTGVLSFPEEDTITRVQRSQVQIALESGLNVIIDDMHLRNKYLVEWDRFAQKHGATFIIHTVETPVDVCVERDSARERQVGEKIIRDMAAKFTRKGKFDPYVAPQDIPDSVWDPVEWIEGLPETVLVDLDGTMFDLNGRDPYDVSERIRRDTPRRAVVDLVNLLSYQRIPIHFFSGRKESARAHSEWALQQLLPSYVFSLTMRADDDNRKDDIVKYEMFNEKIRGKYNVRFVLDDRDQVVKMWRAMGLDCFQVNYGAF